MCILFVEDETVITMMAEFALQDAGHDIMAAEHASAAVRLIADHPGHFTCLVTDIHMPGELTGRDVVEHMHERYSATPVIVATARPEALTTPWRELHRVTILEKPYTPGMLVETIERLLKRAKTTEHQDTWASALIRLEGEVAGEAHLPRRLNPYLAGTPGHDAWAEGWDGIKAAKRKLESK